MNPQNMVCTTAQPANVAGAVSIDEAVARWRDALSGEDKTVRTIETYLQMVRQVAKWGNWITVKDAKPEAVLAFVASRKRNDHDGKAWENGACRLTFTIMRSFGRFLDMSGIVSPSPFDRLKLPKKQQQRHKHPFTESEARGFLAASLARHARDKRARGHAPLVWFTLFMTGLRHAEVQPVCKENKYGGLKWRDLHLDGEFPGIWTDPKWAGNKSRSRDWLPLHPRLVDLLKAHHETVPHRPDDPVFPIWPIRKTWVEDRERSKLPDRDADGRALSTHATRASYCTWIGKLVLPEGLRDRMCRHELGISERVYNTRNKEEMRDAIAQLPDIWPEMGMKPPDKISTSKEKKTKGLEPAKPIRYSDVGKQHDSPPQQHDRTTDPAVCPNNGTGGDLFAGSGGRDGHSDGVAGSDPLTPISGLNMGPNDLVRTLQTLNLIVSALALRNSAQESGDEQRSETERRRTA